MWSSLLRDRVTLACLGVLLVVTAPYAFPILPDGGLEYFNQWLSGLPLHLLMVGAFVTSLRRASHPLERRFWKLVVAGGVCLLLAQTMFFATPDLVDFRVDLLQDFLYVGFYSTLAIAFELRFTGSPGDEARGVRIASTVTFIGGLLTYFIIIPGVVERATYDRFIPSIFLFVVLDAHLVVRLAGLRYRAPRSWRATYSFFLAGFSLWLVLDLVELLDARGTIPWPAHPSLLDAAWFLPFVPMVFGARAWRHDANGTAALPAASRESRLARFPALTTQPLFYAAVFPLLHVTAYVADVASPTLRDEREWLVLALLPILAGLSFLHHRLLERTNEELEIERERVAERVQRAHRMEAVGRLAGGIAHDFNNLIQVIRTSNEVLASRISNAPLALANSAEIAEATARAANLTEQLLAIGKRNSIDPRPVELNEVVWHTMAMIERLMCEDIDVEVVARDGAGWVRVDRHQVEQTILNLAINARDAMPSGGTLRIETALVERVDPASPTHATDEPSQWAVLTLSDTGSGMSADTKARAFEPFFTTKSEGKGTGLGLSTVYGFISHSGGFIELESEPGTGTTLRIYLPSYEGEIPIPAETIAHDVASASGRREASANGSEFNGNGTAPVTSPSPASSAPCAERTILVVENENAVRGVIRELLEDVGFVVEVACCGEEALGLLADGVVPDLMLTDVRMPGMHGTELSEIVRERLPATKIMYMTGYATDPNQGEDTLIGPVLTKPFTRDSLTRQIHEVLDSESA